MFKKSLALAMLAAIAIGAPAALADNQVQGASNEAPITAVNNGKRNRIKIVNRTYVIQSQRRARRLLCKEAGNQAPSNQTQGASNNAPITAINNGDRNRIKIDNNTYIGQGQTIDCGKK